MLLILAEFVFLTWDIVNMGARSSHHLFSHRINFRESFSVENEFFGLVLVFDTAAVWFLKNRDLVRASSDHAR